MAVQRDIALTPLSGYGIGNVEVRHSSMVSIDDGGATDGAASSPLCSLLGKVVFHLLIPAEAIKNKILQCANEKT